MNSPSKSSSSLTKPCVFQIPKSLSYAKPAYTPQLIGLGPYHHFRPEFSVTDSQKCFAVIKFLNPKQILAFKDLVVEKLKLLEPVIRACYYKDLDFDGNTLAWIMTIDGLYLLQFLSTYVEEREKAAMNDPDQVQKLAMDIMMLENQIPVVLLREISKPLQLQCNDPKNDLLLRNFYLFCQEQSPLRLTDESDNRDYTGPAHLLDYMYHLIVNNRCKDARTPVANPHRRSINSAATPAIKGIPRESTAALPRSTGGIMKIAANSVSALETAVDVAAALGIKGAVDVQNQLKLLKTLWKILPGAGRTAKQDEAATLTTEEIDIPSVSQLYENSNIKFKLRHGGIRDIEFYDMEKIFYLPVIALNANSEVVLRNLMAYEAERAKPEGSPMELAEYVDLMCGIIDTTEDVILLRQEGIIEGNLTDEKIADIFNSIKSSTGNSNNASNIEVILSRVRELRGSNLSSRL